MGTGSLSTRCGLLESSPDADGVLNGLSSSRLASDGMLPFDDLHCLV
jgi:hypothetical protein